MGQCLDSCQSGRVGAKCNNCCEIIKVKLIMSSLGEVQRIIGLSLSKIQMGRNQRGGLPLHKNLLVATVLNKARDVYMQETMYMNYRQLMACGQFSQEDQEDMDDDDTPDTEDYEEDSESDVEDDNEPSGPPSSTNSGMPLVVASTASNVTELPSGGEACAVVSRPTPTLPSPPQQRPSGPTEDRGPTNQGVHNSSLNKDEGFIDESDCDCDARNFCPERETRVPFQYCFNCAPFHPSNGRGPTLVGPAQCGSLTGDTTHDDGQPEPVVQQATACQEPEDKVLIYDMDSKSTRINQAVKRKRQVSSEETEDAINSILPKKRKENQQVEGESKNLDDSGFEEDEKVFHPAFRGQNGPNGMEVDQITSLVSIFSFGQQLGFPGGPGEQAVPAANQAHGPPPGPPKKKGSSKEDDDSDSDSDTSSDSGHSSDDPEAQEKSEEDEKSVCSNSCKDELPGDLENASRGTVLAAAV